jgi:DNA-directed RNA polymerase specialized sigma24 family protein
MAKAERHIETPPFEGDIALLHQYARSQEPAVFMELSRRYAGVVYGTCLGITANVHDAEELTQDCFFELARRAATLRSSVGGWLHSLATHRALNAVRSRNRRRGHSRGHHT